MEPVAMQIPKALACAVCLAVPGLAVLLFAAAAWATLNKDPSTYCIALTDPKFTSWQPMGAGRQYKFLWSGEASTPACPLLGSPFLGTSYVQNFGLTVDGTGTWNGPGKPAQEYVTFAIWGHPIGSYNGFWSYTANLQCPSDPWLNKVTCKLIDNTPNVQSPTSPYNALYSAFFFSGPFPKTKLSPSEQQAVKTSIAAKAAFSALEQSITIKNPTGATKIKVGAPLLIVITNPFKATVNLHVNVKGNDFTPAAFVMQTNGTAVAVPAGKLVAAAVWTVRAQLASTSDISKPGPSVDFTVTP